MWCLKGTSVILFAALLLYPSVPLLFLYISRSLEFMPLFMKKMPTNCVLRAKNEFLYEVFVWLRATHVTGMIF